MHPFFLDDAEGDLLGCPVRKTLPPYVHAVGRLGGEYIHFPSGDQAASVHCDGTGPTGFPSELPAKGTNRHGSHDR
jgi:hypothetical protein